MLSMMSHSNVNDIEDDSESKIDQLNGNSIDKLKHNSLSTENVTGAAVMDELLRDYGKPSDERSSGINHTNDDDGIDEDLERMIEQLNGQPIGKKTKNSSSTEKFKDNVVNNVGIEVTVSRDYRKPKHEYSLKGIDQTNDDAIEEDLKPKHEYSKVIDHTNDDAIEEDLKNMIEQLNGYPEVDKEKDNLSSSTTEMITADDVNDTDIDRIFRDYRKLLINQENSEETIDFSDADFSTGGHKKPTSHKLEKIDDEKMEDYVRRLTKKKPPGPKDCLCPICGKLFGRIHYKKHMRFAHCTSLKPDVKCKECGKGFTHKYKLQQHSKIHAEACLKCSYPNCEKVFRVRRNRRKHEQQIHEGHKKFMSTCGVCSKKFETRDEMLAHKSWHKPEDFPKCRICFERLSSRALRELHERRHRNETFTCNFCDKKFEHQAALTVHRRIHTGELPYKCPKCSLAFSQQYSRIRHIKTHRDGEKLLNCDQCDNLYRSKRDLNRHQRLHTKSGKEAKEVLIKCPTCTLEYRTIRGLRAHHLESHEAPLCEEGLVYQPVVNNTRPSSAPSVTLGSKKDSCDGSTPTKADGGYLDCETESPTGDPTKDQGSNLERSIPLSFQKKVQCRDSGRSCVEGKGQPNLSTNRKQKEVSFSDSNIARMEEQTDGGRFTYDESCRFMQFATEAGAMGMPKRRSTRNKVIPTYFPREETSEDESLSSFSDDESIYEPSDGEDEEKEDEMNVVDEELEKEVREEEEEDKEEKGEEVGEDEQNEEENANMLDTDDKEIITADIASEWDISNIKSSPQYPSNVNSVSCSSSGADLETTVDRHPDEEFADENQSQTTSDQSTFEFTEKPPASLSPSCLEGQREDRTIGTLANRKYFRQRNRRATWRVRGRCRTAKLLLRRIKLADCVNGVIVVKTEGGGSMDQIIPRPSTKFHSLKCEAMKASDN